MKKILALIAAIVLLSVSIAIAGNAYGKKVENSAAARECAGVGFDPHADELGVADDVIECLQARGLAVNSAVCTPEADGCCNVAYSTTDPDCVTGGELCGDGTDNDGDGLADEECLPTGGQCIWDWQCQSGACTIGSCA